MKNIQYKYSSDFFLFTTSALGILKIVTLTALIYGICSLPLPLPNININMIVYFMYLILKLCTDNR